MQNEIQRRCTSHNGEEPHSHSHQAGVGGVDVMDEKSSALFVFFLDDRVLAFPLDVVIHVLFSVEVTLLPSVPDIVAGVINYHGEIVPVVDLRVRFWLSPTGDTHF